MTEPEEISAAEYVALKVKERKPNKYLNKKTTVDEYDFDSLKEARHYGILKLREAAGEITNIQLQPRWPIDVNGVKVTRYTADFSFTDQDGVTHVQDVKSTATKTRAYVMRRKLMLAVHGITVEEV